MSPGKDAKRAPIRSMTGYALVKKTTAPGELTLSLRSVNHRGLDLHFYLGGEFAGFENPMRSLLKQQVGRGHIEVRLSFAWNEQVEGASCNHDLLRRYVHLFRQTNEELQLNSRPDLNILFTLPGIFESGREGPRNLGNGFERELMEALAACIAELNACREREGRELCVSIQRELAAVEEATAKIRSLREALMSQLHNRLREKLRELLADAVISESRLAEEAALLADRSDVEEELTRLSVHAGELGRILQNGGEVGKRLDFLLQEMNRETNTALSKISGAGDSALAASALALGIKANIERIREQALNLE